MSEALNKSDTAEMKRHGSNKAKRAAVSVQTARMIDKLLERSQGLNGSSTEFRTNAITAFKDFKGATKDSNEAVLTDSVLNYNLGEKRDTLAISTGERQVKPLIGKEKTVKTASISRSSKDMLDYRVGTRHLDIDPHGKRKPTETHRFGDGESYSYKQDANTVIAQAAPALYEVKKAIDDAEQQAAEKAA